MRKIEGFSAFQITGNNNFGFSPDEYSMFKYGSKNVARKFGHALANEFIASHSTCLKNNRLVVIPSAHSHIQTASCIMASFFIDRLNSFLFKNACSPVEQTKIHRTVTYREDYGEMSAEQRFNMIKGDKFHIDKSFLEGKTLIFIDDIKITGTHERIIVKMLDNFDIQNHCFMLYYADLENPDIDPRIENFFNSHFVKTLSDLDLIIKNDAFVFNTRVVKYILNSRNADCVDFLKNQTFEFVRNLFFLAIGNDYGQFDDYRQNLLYIQEIVEKNELREYDQTNNFMGLPVNISF